MLVPNTQGPVFRHGKSHGGVLKLKQATSAKQRIEKSMWVAFRPIEFVFCFSCLIRERERLERSGERADTEDGPIRCGLKQAAVQAENLSKWHRGSINFLSKAIGLLGSHGIGAPLIFCRKPLGCWAAGCPGRVVCSSSREFGQNSSNKSNVSSAVILPGQWPIGHRANENKSSDTSPNNGGSS